MCVAINMADPVLYLHPHEGICCTHYLVLRSGDGCVHVFHRGLPGLVLPAHHGTDALSCDWSPHQPHHIATAGADAVVTLWDTRALHHPLVLMQVHLQLIIISLSFIINVMSKSNIFH